MYATDSNPTWKTWVEAWWEWLPSWPLYWPRALTYLSPVRLPDGQHLYISDAPSAADEALLRRHNITGLVSIRTPYAILSPIYYRIDGLPADEVEQLCLSLDDRPSSNLLSHLETVIYFIRRCLRERRNVLVHCTAGRSRSVSFVIAYLMIVYDLAYDVALEMVRSARPELCMNEGFIQQLQTLDRLLHRMRPTQPVPVAE